MSCINKNTQLTNQNTKLISNKKWVVFPTKPKFYNEKDKGMKIVPAEKWFNSRCHSPKSCMIKYDNSFNIVDVPEEYQEYIRKKLIKLWINRSSLKKAESRNMHTLYHNLSTNMSLSRNSLSEVNLISIRTRNESTKKWKIQNKTNFGKKKSNHEMISKNITLKWTDG